MERHGEASLALESPAISSLEAWGLHPTSTTPIEDGMWEMRLGEEDSYPERPGEVDCIYYMRTGFCGYGSRCRFNHPPDRGSVVGGGRGGGGGGEYPERLEQPVCKFYMRTGTCKFGSTCKYHHPIYGCGSFGPLALNYFGYPLRQGERECSYYVRTGYCKFGATCKFHHPQPTDVQIPAPISVPTLAPVPAVSPAALYASVQSSPNNASHPYGVVSNNWQVGRPPTIPSSYVQGPYGHMLMSSGVVPIPGWSTYGTSLSSAASEGVHPGSGAAPIYGVTRLSPSAPAYMGPCAPVTPGSFTNSVHKDQVFPERPGQDECQYYMKTGDCKYGSSCKYHHPPERNSSKVECDFSALGLPLRPGAASCAYYSQHGLCKFGRSCKFDHPIPMAILTYSPSTSSLAEMPVAPYPSSSLATPAPSSSSSDLRRSKDSSSTRLSSTSLGSGNSIFSKGSSTALSSTFLHPSPASN